MIYGHRGTHFESVEAVKTQIDGGIIGKRISNTISIVWKIRMERCAKLGGEYK